MKAKSDSSVAAKVAIVHAGERQVHASSTNGVYATLCGLDGDDPDPAVQQSACTVNPQDKITCPDCFAIWFTAKEYRRTDFHPSLKNWSNRKRSGA